MKLLEPDVTLTDFVLAIECAVFVLALSATGRWGLPYHAAFIFFFAASSAASLFGGLVHGFYPNRHRGIGRFLWRASLLAISASAVAIWSIGTQLLFSPALAEYMTLGAIGIFLIYTYLVLTRVPPFLWAVIFYVPAVLFMIAAFAVAYFKSGEQAMLYGLAGAILALAAAIVQRAKIKLHPQYFNHNAFYHLVQAVAFLMIFLAARQMILY